MESTSFDSSVESVSLPPSTGVPEGEAAAPVASPINDKPSVEDIAAYDFQRLLPQFYEALKPLSRRVVQKVITALLEYPLMHKELKWSFPGEKRAFDLGMQIMDSKFVLQTAVMNIMKDKAAVAKLKEDYDRITGGE